MKRTKKLFYVPGLISLTGILIALPSFLKNNTPVKEYCLPLFALADSNKYDWFIRPLKYDMEKYVDKKKKIKFEFTENKMENYNKLEIIRYEALKLKYTLDTSTVILLTLSDSISYGEFVSLVDMCEIDRLKRYSFWDNKFVIFGEWPDKKKELPEIPMIYCGYQPLEKQVIKPTFIDVVKQKMTEYSSLKKGSYLLVGWIVLLISFLYFRKRISVLQKH